MRAAAVGGVASLLADGDGASVLTGFVARFRTRMLDALEESSAAVKKQALELAEVLLEQGFVDLLQLVRLTRCVAQLALACATCIAADVSTQCVVGIC